MAETAEVVKTPEQLADEKEAKRKEQASIEADRISNALNYYKMAQAQKGDNRITLLGSVSGVKAFQVTKAQWDEWVASKELKQDFVTQALTGKFIRKGVETDFALVRTGREPREPREKGETKENLGGWPNITDMGTDSEGNVTNQAVLDAGKRIRAIVDDIEASADWKLLHDTKTEDFPNGIDITVYCRTNKPPKAKKETA